MQALIGIALLMLDFRPHFFYIITVIQCTLLETRLQFLCDRFKSLLFEMFVSVATHTKRLSNHQKGGYVDFPSPYRLLYIWTSYYEAVAFFISFATNWDIWFFMVVPGVSASKPCIFRAESRAVIWSRDNTYFNLGLLEDLWEKKGYNYERSDGKRG